MATIRRHRKKWQVQIRRAGLAPVSKSFLELKDAKAWARHKEVQADRRELPSDPRALQQVTPAELVVLYRDTVTVHKRGRDVERAVLSAFLIHPICRRRLQTSLVNTSQCTGISGSTRSNRQPSNAS